MSYRVFTDCGRFEFVGGRWRVVRGLRHVSQSWEVSQREQWAMRAAALFRRKPVVERIVRAQLDTLHGSFTITRRVVL